MITVTNPLVCKTWKKKKSQRKKDSESKKNLEKNNLKVWEDVT